MCRAFQTVRRGPLVLPRVSRASRRSCVSTPCRRLPQVGWRGSGEDCRRVQSVVGDLTEGRPSRCRQPFRERSAVRVRSQLAGKRHAWQAGLPSMALKERDVMVLKARRPRAPRPKGRRGRGQVGARSRRPVHQGQGRPVRGRGRGSMDGRSGPGRREDEAAQEDHPRRPPAMSGERAMGPAGGGRGGGTARSG